MASSARARGLGAELRQLRKNANLEAQEVGRRLGWSKSTMSRVESGARRVDEADVSAILAIIGVTGQERERLLNMAREIDQPGWWETSDSGLPAQLKALLSFEKDATRISESAVTLVPGLLQTASYTRALMLGGGVPEDAVEARVAVRRGRQDIIFQRTPAEVLALIDEGVLMREVGGPEVMAEQLRYLADTADRDNVDIRLLPFSAHPGVDGSFLLLDFPKVRSIVHIEHHRSSAFLDEPDDVAAYVRLRDSLMSKACTPERTVRALKAYAEKWESESP
ncbi:transcriptional regulator, XRE family [Actinopolyspora xinjiangensis]|uniref:Transcriptional regulator, XRE family n=1 Tax=Actinopolyspora xinjiangensis TaxID=405564 RepID=A0A1H0PD29_9ACTN|nr:helix-turn-helix transcriptional regulator [Actinopolyspora xinjiangensis]SDP02516.1 transcriptional regulator, XRE family [Actinopolyspora xinjiangensis]